MIWIVNQRFKLPDNAVVVDTTSRATGWSRGLSPFILGPVDLYDGMVSQNVENAWQFSKLYPYYADDNGNPDERYWRWAKAGWADSYAHRYPIGRDVKPLCSYWAGEKLGYVEARKQIYIPLYAGAVKDTEAFKQLTKLHAENPEIYLVDFDAHSLPPGSFEYWVLWNNPNIKVGHAYVLAMLLEGVIE